ncbi:pyridoxal phosphate-dependent transferase [Radiomyces spectabilis]|uniref:pyridoxal phosphate-dependent transferase n=1 Tax=Radiomyces spectabilis TaxID=64574 RepID=UPI00221FB544|nr:pyridoxal phosphate-dependent transferase [Radiomyces spectabilis]KAI8367683.1 pyridoxal phosphate-dependent transferase [Radiomyces spectabilis]
MIDLLIGKPSTDLLPAALFAKAAQKALERSDAPSLILQYGPELGNANFLDRLARFLSLEYHSTVESQHLCVSTGASFALQHMLTLLTRPESTTRFAFFQNPTYHLVYNIFLDCGFKKDQFIPVSENDTGLDVDALAEFLEKHFPQGKDESNNDDGFYSAVMYCVPTHANPTSSILSAAKRARLVQLARRYNMLIICDDVYDILTFDGNVPKRLVAYDLETEGPPVVVSNGSFSKILAPGARVGWMEAQTALIQRLGTW